MSEIPLSKPFSDVYGDRSSAASQADNTERGTSRAPCGMFYCTGVHRQFPVCRAPRKTERAPSMQDLHAPDIR